MECPSVPAVRDTALPTPPRRSPFKNRPPWAIHKPALGAPQSIVEALQQPTSPVDAVDIFRRTAETGSWPGPEKSNKLGIPRGSVHRSRWSGASLEDDLVQASVGASKPANSYKDDAVSTVPTEVQEAHRPEGPGNTSPRSDRLGFALRDLEADVSSTEIDSIVARPTQHGAPTCRVRDTSNTASSAHPASPEVADSNDGRAIDKRTDERLRYFVFDVFAEGDDGLVNDGQPPAKRRRRASSAASSSVRTGEARTPPVVDLPHAVGLYADPNRDVETSEDDYEWQAQRIVAERQTPSGLEYEVSVQKILGLPRAALDTKLVRRYRAEQRAATRVRTRWSSRLQITGSSVDSGASS